MSWIAPDVTRTHEPLVGTEIDILTGMLERHRATLLHKCAGLSAEQLAQWAVPPSNLSLLGLIRHLTDVERTWFQRRLAGHQVERVYPGRDADFEHAEPDGAEAAYTALLAEWDASRKTAAGAGLDDQFTHERHGQVSVRWLYTHLIEEYAQHNGHADLLRERIDGVTDD